jgi:dTDP-4-dehydrorhamnose reductase
MKLIGVTGANGYIGKALVKAGAVPIFVDVTRPEEIESQLSLTKYDVILHLAAKSKPDWCEETNNRFILSSVNVRGTYNVMYAASQANTPCVLMSTGQIWKGGFWERDHHEYDKPTPPVNQYGLSKLAAESIARMFFEEGGKIVRSSYVFSAARPNIVAKLSSLRAGETLNEPSFIRRSFIYLGDYVKLLLEYCERINEMPDILHLAGSETVSWYDFTWELACQYGYDSELVKSRRTELPNMTPRPNNAGLDTSIARSLGFRIPTYIEGIVRMKNEI